MHKKLFFIFCLFLTIFAFQGCSKSELKQGKLPERFNEFYQKFHSDSTFQIQSIIFPLDGKPENVDENYVEGSFKWNATNWEIHKKIDNKDNQMKHTFITLNEHFVTEKVVYKQTGYGIERRFAKVGNRWMLVYYQALNPM